MRKMFLYSTVYYISVYCTSQCETGHVSHSLGSVLTFLIKHKQLA